MKFNELIPELMVKNIKISLDFYVKVLGFKIEYQREENKFAFLSKGNAQIMIQEDNGVWKTGNLEYPFGRGINFQIEVQDLKGLLNSIEKNKYPIKVKPSINSYRVGKKEIKCEEFLIMDPDGYLLRLSKTY